MGWSRWVMAALALVPGLWMTFDGGRALTVGDYVTPRSGPYAGQLGPWHHAVGAVGVDPRGTAMKVTFVAFGAAWLAGAAACALGVRCAAGAVLGLGVATLWYLPVGTAVGAIEIVLAGWALRQPAR